MTLKSLEKSDYERIKEGELYVSPKRNEYEYGRHFRCTRHPKCFFNRPFRSTQWFIDVVLPNNDYMWYHSNYNSWDFSDEFVISSWSSSTAYCRTIKSLKRLMVKKWKLPIGTVVKATGRYAFDNYEFVITK